MLKPIEGKRWAEGRCRVCALVSTLYFLSPMSWSKCAGWTGVFMGWPCTDWGGWERETEELSPLTRSGLSLLSWPPGKHRVRACSCLSLCFCERRSGSLCYLIISTQASHLTSGRGWDWLSLPSTPGLRLEMGKALSGSFRVWKCSSSPAPLAFQSPFHLSRRGTMLSPCYP